MARSAYVYVVSQPGCPPAAFTVRYELAHWLTDLLKSPSGLIPGTTIWRCRDGLDKAPPSQVHLHQLGLAPTTTREEKR